MELLTEFLPILLFFIAYQSHGIYVATGVAIVASLVIAGWQRLRKGHVKKTTLITLGIVVVLGGATLLLHDPTFVMWKPTAVYWIFALLFLGSHFIGDRPMMERMMGHVVEVPQQIWKRVNIAWVVIFVVLGIANLLMVNPYFIAQHNLDLAAGYHVKDIDNCAEQLTGSLLQLCQDAKSMESQWVKFKLFGLTGIMVFFTIGQVFYLARYMQAPAQGAGEQSGDQ